MRTRLLDEFPDLAAAIHPQDTRVKIARMLASGVYAAPDAHDNLPDAIRWATELATQEPWCPAECRALLVRWVTDANKMLAEVQATSSGGGSSK